jgi:hypothetical protein
MFQDEKELLKINRVKAVVKDIKVSGKGIVLNLENVQLTGTQISEVSALVGGMVYVDLEERLPQSRKAENEVEGQLSINDLEGEPEKLTEQEVADQLNLED